MNCLSVSLQTSSCCGLIKFIVELQITILAKAPPKPKAAEHSLSNRHTDRKLTNKCGGWWYSSRRSQSSYLINCLSNCYWLPSIPFSSCCCSIDNFVYTREPKQPGRKGVAATVVFDLTIQPSSIHLMIPPTPPHHSLSDTLLFRRCPFAVSCFTVFSPCSCTVKYEGRAGGVKYIGPHNNHRPTKTNFISDFSEIHNTSTHGRMQLS